MENYLFTLPENERNTVKEFLLMQQERIENLEKLVDQLQRSIYSMKWKLKGFKSISELHILATKVKDNIDKNTQRICYHIDTFDVFIEFLYIQNQFMIEDLLKSRDFSHIQIIITQDNPDSYYPDSKWKYLSTLLKN
jgi:hypothetical protein